MKTAILVTLLSIFASCASYPKTIIRPEPVTLTLQNFATLKGDITKQNCDKVAKEIKKLDKERGDKKHAIFLVVNSGGGSVDAFHKFTEQIKHYKNLKTITLYAASAAHMIVQHHKGRRLITELGQMMAHNITYGGSRRAPLQQQDNKNRMYRVQEDWIEKQIADRIGIPLKQYQLDLKYEKWLVGAEAVKENHADKVVEIFCNKEVRDAKNEQYQARGFMGMPVKISVPKCPIF